MESQPSDVRQLLPAHDDETDDDGTLLIVREGNDGDGTGTLHTCVACITHESRCPFS